jgi:hypothetical protein
LVGSGNPAGANGLDQVRAPNGNDYGKVLLRQHREQAGHADR